MTEVLTTGSAGALLLFALQAWLFACALIIAMKLISAGAGGGLLAHGNERVRAPERTPLLLATALGAGAFLIEGIFTGAFPNVPPELLGGFGLTQALYLFGKSRR